MKYTVHVPNRKLKIIFLLTFLMGINTPFAQDLHLIDSLNTELDKVQKQKTELGIKGESTFDTSAVNILYQLAFVYFTNDTVKTMKYINDAMSLTKAIKYKKGEAKIYNVWGCLKDEMGNVFEALDLFTLGLQKANEANDERMISIMLSNIGNIYSKQGKYAEALSNYLASLTKYVKINDKGGQASTYLSIGIIYADQHNDSAALDYYMNALRLYSQIGNKEGIATTNINIGNLYFAKGEYMKSLEYQTNALKINTEIDRKSNIAYSYINIATIHDRLGNDSIALENFLKGLRIAEQSGNKYVLINAYINLSSYYGDRNKNKEARFYMNKGLEVAKQINSLQQLKISYQNLSLLDSVLGNYKAAYEEYKLYVAYRDTMSNLENAVKMAQYQMQFDYDKKEEIEKTKRANKDALDLKEFQKQKLMRNSFLAGFIIVLLFAGIIFNQKNKINKQKKFSELEKKRSDELLLNILPEEVAKELKQNGKCEPKTFSMVTVLFADFKDFTSIGEKISAELLVTEINECFSAFDIIVNKYNVEKIKTVGDAYICAGGLPALNYTHASDVSYAALEMRDYMLKRKSEKENKGEIAFDMRIGIHTGPVVAGIVGTKKFSYDIWGDTVNLAARIESNGEPGKVNISSTTFLLVKDKFNCTSRGKIAVKNKGELEMFFIEHN